MIFLPLKIGTSAACLPPLLRFMMRNSPTRIKTMLAIVRIIVLIGARKGRIGWSWGTIV